MKMRFTTEQAVRYLEESKRVKRPVSPIKKKGCGCGGKKAMKHKMKAVQKTPPSRKIFI